jgi:hypothetical protein
VQHRERRDIAEGEDDVGGRLSQDSGDISIIGENPHRKIIGKS